MENEIEREGVRRMMLQYMFDQNYWLPVHGGGRITFPPLPSQIRIEDVAHGLSNDCRYAGQIKFYSVAEHTARMAMAALRTNILFAGPILYLANQFCNTPGVSLLHLLDKDSAVRRQLEIMMSGQEPVTKASYLHVLQAICLHDAAEAYLRDIPRPVKRQPFMLGYRMAEEYFSEMIMEALAHRNSGTEPIRVWVKALDNAMIRREFAMLFPYADAPPCQETHNNPSADELVGLASATIWSEWGWPPDKARRIYSLFCWLAGLSGWAVLS